MKKLLLSAVMLMTVFVSCKKTETQFQSQSTMHIHSVSKNGVVDDAANPDNPYDEIGYKHNYALQATRSVWIATGTTMSEAYEAANNYMIGTYGASFALPDKSTGVTEIRNLMLDQPFMESTISNSGLSDDGMKSLAKLIAIVNGVDFNGSYADFKADVIDFESSILINSQLTEKDKVAILQSSSVARYSVLYWQNEAGGENTSSNNPCECRIWNWVKNHSEQLVKCGLADIGGALTAIAADKDPLAPAAAASVTAGSTQRW